MIKLTHDFMDKLADAARATLRLTFDRQTAEGKQQFQDFAKSLLEAPDDDRTIAVLNHIDRHTEQPVAKKVLHAGFKPKIDHGFQLDEKDNYFRRGKPFPDAASEEPEFTH